MNYRIPYRVLFLACAISIAHAKVNIFARYFGQPEFIKYQYLFFKKNLKDDYKLIIVDDSNSTLVSEQIKKECIKYKIKYIRIPRTVFELPKLPIMDYYIEANSPSFECSVSVQYIYDNYIVPSKNICVILDNDIFLLSSFSIEKYLATSAFAYVEQKRGSISYMLPNFLIFNPHLMPQKKRLNFNLGTILGSRTDSGGYTHFYLRDYKDLAKKIPIYNLHNTVSILKQNFIGRCPLLFTSVEWRSHYFIDKELFLHIRMGSNWSKDPNYLTMVDEVTGLFDQLLYKDLQLSRLANFKIIIQG